MLLGGRRGIEPEEFDIELARIVVVSSLLFGVIEGPTLNEGSLFI